MNLASKTITCNFQMENRYNFYKLNPSVEAQKELDDRVKRMDGWMNECKNRQMMGWFFWGGESELFYPAAHTNKHKFKGLISPTRTNWTGHFHGRKERWSSDHRPIPISQPEGTGSVYAYFLFGVKMNIANFSSCTFYVCFFGLFFLYQATS